MSRARSNSAESPNSAESKARELAPRGLRRVGPRLIAATLIVLSIGHIATSAHTIWSEKRMLSMQLDARGQSLVTLASAACLQPLLHDEDAVLRTFVDSLAAGRTDVTFARLERADGRVLRESINPAATTDAARIQQFQADVLAPNSDADRPGERIGRVTLGLSTDGVEQLAATRSRELLLQAAASFLVLALVLWLLLQRWVSRPIQALDACAAKLGAGDLETPVAAAGDDEFGRLARTLDDMRSGLGRSYGELCERNDELARVCALRDQALADLGEALARANDASTAKSEFLATISHEIRTPMNGVIGNASLLLNSDIDGEKREFAEAIRTSAESLRLVVEEILDYSRLDAGQITIEPVAVDLGALVDDIFASHAPQAIAKKLALNVYVDPEVPTHVTTDPRRLRQVLCGLLGNALKFTDEGSVTLKVAVDGPARNTSDITTLRFAVIDTGIGVPKDAHTKLFEPFTQADSSTSRRHGGTGLGLAICKQLVDLLGGQIGFQSSPGNGSVFWFTTRVTRLADAEVPGPKPALPAPSAPNLRRSLVLLVEDNPVNQRMALHMLRKSGHAAELAENGAVAVEKLSKTDYTLVLMDCSMPVMDGYEATRRIRERERETGVHVPIIALTANAMPGDRERCLAAGMDEYLPKPVTATQLQAKIAELTNSTPA